MVGASYHQVQGMEREEVVAPGDIGTSRSSEHMSEGMVQVRGVHLLRSSSKLYFEGGQRGERAYLERGIESIVGLKRPTSKRRLLADRLT